ncbi:CENPX protein, partial [Halcyon senegalensis]|nr:CENPX protein [Halcyon senegalensis]
STALLSAQETVDRLLRLHFRDGRTRGTGARAAAGGPGRAPAFRKRFVFAVNGDAQLLMAEMLKVFVRGERAALAAARSPPRPGPLQRPRPSACTVEAAARAARQAEAEDLEKVNIEHVEKVLPQLVRDC